MRVLRVVRVVRQKWACRCGQAGVATAPLPEALQEHSPTTPAMLAHVAVSKYQDHLPLHRQSRIFKRQGAALSPRTLGDWIAKAAFWLQPVVLQMGRELLEAPLIHSDDTGIPVLHEDKDHVHRGHLWLYQGVLDDGMPHHAVFTCTPTRSGKHGPQEFLKDYRGYRVADAFSGYDALFRDGAVKEVGCWAHARRKLFEALGSHPTLAAEALKQIQALHAVEWRVKERRLDPDAARALTAELRRTESTALVEAMKKWLDVQQPRVPPKRPLGQAITYARNPWTALTRFLEDPRLPLDDNFAERGLRIGAVGRKNWILAGSDAGAERAATLYSITTSCRILGLNPQE